MTYLIFSDEMKETLIRCQSTLLKKKIIFRLILSLTISLFALSLLYGTWNNEGDKSSVTRLCNFYKFLATNCLTKVAQIIWCLYGLFLIMSLLCKSVWLLFGQFLGKLGNYLFHHLVTLDTT